MVRGRLEHPGRDGFRFLFKPISFESDLPIIGTGTSFSTWATVFRPEVVAAFARSLRVLRVFSMAGEDSRTSGRVSEAASEILAAH